MIIPAFFVVLFINAKLVGSLRMARLYKSHQKIIFSLMLDYFPKKIFLFSKQKRVLFFVILAVNVVVHPASLTDKAL